MNEIERLISERIKEKGRISYKEFIEIALYYPEIGYYYRFRPGKEGDFLTSPTSSSLFGFVIGNFVIEFFRSFKGDFEILELGGGEGFLAKDVLNFIKENEPELFNRISYKIFELFKREGIGERISYITSLDSVDKFEGLIISNEFFDSLPFRIVENFKGNIKEVYIKFDGIFLEELGEPSQDSIDYLKRFPLELENGERAEIRWEDYKFMKLIAGKMSRGGILIIDYGSEKPKKDTARAFKNHRVFKDILSQPGERDITSDVNFDLLIEAGKEEGLEKVFFYTQERFLLEFGVIEILEKFGDSGFFRNQAKILLSPEFMGSRFKVLFLRKGYKVNISKVF
jgi:SAM-dependent MidA family methyltransferase